MSCDKMNSSKTLGHTHTHSLAKLEMEKFISVAATQYNRIQRQVNWSVTNACPIFMVVHPYTLPN